RMLDEQQTKQMAADLCGDLKKAGLPLRHAGSFGFDFGAAEWFRDTTRNRCVVRIAVPDLPTPLWDQVVQAVAQWWSRHEDRGKTPSSASRPQVVIPYPHRARRPDHVLACRRHIPRIRALTSIR